MILICGSGIIIPARINNDAIESGKQSEEYNIMDIQNEQENILRSFSGFQVTQKWITVIANILLMLGEVIFVGLLAYVILNLSQDVMLHVGIPGILISGTFISIGYILEKSQARN